jgi:acetate kinase
LPVVINEKGRAIAGPALPQIFKKLFLKFLMEWCGILIDRQANDEMTGLEGHISADKSTVDLMVVPVDEAEVLANEAVNVISFM